jgi:hypothetical protein
MSLQHAVLYQAFREITNFIHNNKDNWDKFCTKTAHTTRKAKKAPSPSEQPSKHKITKNKGLLSPKPLLQENPHRFVLFPIHHADIWRMYKKAKASFWTAEEIDLSADLTDWVRLSDTKHHFISHVLAFCAASDEIINENLSSNFTIKVTAPKVRCFYGLQIAVKNIHSKTYSLSLTCASRIQKRNCTYSTPSKQYHVSNAKPTGLSNGATPARYPKVTIWE